METHATRLDTTAVDAILRKTGGVPPITFAGLPGTAEFPDHIRLYQDSELMSFVEIPADAVLDARQSSDGGPALVRCRRDMRIRVGAVATVNADTVFTAVEPQEPAGTIPMSDPPPKIPKVPVPPAPTVCRMSVKWRLTFRWAMGPDGLILLAVAIPVFILDCT